MDEILSGYRIGMLYEHSYEGGLSKSVGASLLHIYRDAPSTSKVAFQSFWNAEVQRAQVDGYTLIIMKNRYGIRTPWCPMLENMEETEWYENAKKVEDDSDGGLMYDSWGDVVERGWKGAEKENE